MATYAQLDSNNRVINVFVGRDPSDSENQEQLEDFYSSVFESSVKMTFKDRSQRKNYAGIGFTYSEDRDAFISPKPFDSWILNEDTCQYEAPIDFPDDGVMYYWNEEAGDWSPIIYPAQTPEVEE